MLDPAHSPRDARRGIQSIEIGFALIRALAQGPGRMTLKDLAAAAGMTPSKAHLYLVSFVRLGLVRQEEGGVRYGLGAGAIELGLAAMNQLDVVALAAVPMEMVVAHTGASLTLSVWGNRGPTIIHRRDGHWPVPLQVRVGFVLPVLTSATGRVFAAHLPERHWLPLAQSEAAQAPGGVEQVRRLIPDIRAEGLAWNDAASGRGMTGISAPVFGHDGAITATLTALGMAGHDGMGRGGAVAQALTGAAATLSRDLGARAG